MKGELFSVANRPLGKFAAISKRVRESFPREMYVDIEAIGLGAEDRIAETKEEGGSKDEEYATDRET